MCVFLIVGGARWGGIWNNDDDDDDVMARANLRKIRLFFLLAAVLVCCSFCCGTRSSTWMGLFLPRSRLGTISFLLESSRVIGRFQRRLSS